MGSKKTLKTLLKILFSLLALAYVFNRVDLGQVLSTVRESSPLYLLAAFLFFNLSKFVASVRLNRFFRALGLRLGELEALRLYYIGMFYNLFLPGGIGGDGYKIYLLKRHREQKVAPLLAATLLDRISGVVPLLVFGGLLFLASRFTQLWPWLRPLDILGLLLAFPALWAVYRYLFPAFASIFLPTTLLGALTQLFQLASAWMLALALHLDGTLIEVLTLFLLSSVAAVLPISVGGVGIREFIFLAGFSLLGLPADRGVAFALLFFVIGALSSLPGALLRHGLENESLERRRV